MTELVRTLVPCALLIAGIGALLLSTRQWRLPVRIQVWLVGLLLLVGAIVKRPEVAGSGLYKMLLDLVRNWRKPNESALWEILSDNWATVDSVGPPLLDVTTTIAITLAFAALLALTPGERTEKLLRPLLFGLIGALAGGFVALVLVASGLAGYHKDRVYAAVIPEEEVEKFVRDGDTLRIGERLVRLNGIDAPELKQICAYAVTYCGKAARLELMRAVKGALVVCKAPDGLKNGRAPKETLGRPILDCSARRENQAYIASLSRYMIDRRAAVPFRDENGRLKSNLPEYEFGLGCTLRPHLWRNDRRARARFEAGQPLPGETIGVCPLSFQ